MTEEKVNQIESVSLLSDSPAEPDQDILDYQTYCDAIVSLIGDLPSGAPFTMGIFGSWGSGKTTLLKMIRSELVKQRKQSIWVNVWKVGNDEEVWKAFLQAILISVKEELPWYMRWMFHLGLLNKQIDWAKISKKIPELLVKITIVVIPLYFSLLNIVLPDKFYTSPNSIKAISATGTIFGIVLGWFLLLRPYVEAVNERVKVDLQGLVKSSPLKKRVSLLEEFSTFFEAMVGSLVSKKEKLTVFIDDLDRCPPERMVQVLDAIKLFLDLPYCVYLISMDREIVEQAITLKFANYKDPKEEAREYLEKIITLPFDLPPLSGQQMQALVEGLKTNIPEPEECTKVFALGQEPNPRKVKRTINTFLLLWALANKRKELAGEIKPIRLAKLVVIQQNYRDLYLLLTLLPKSLGELEIYFRKASPELSLDVLKSLKDNLPDYLKSFSDNSNLKSLLTLHPIDNQESSNRNFVTFANNEYSVLPEDEIRNYIRLTRTVSPSPSQKMQTDSYPVFVNRVRELEAFNRLLSRQSSQQIFTIEAPGGMGKTALLQQYYRMCLESNIPVALIDLNSTHYVNPVEMMTDITDRLGITDFTPLLANLAREGIIIAGSPSPVDNLVRESINITDFTASPSLLDTLSQNRKITQTFIELLRNFASSKTCVILFDSYERISSESREWLERDLLTAISNGLLPNVVCGLVGRTVKLTHENLTSRGAILDLTLSSFTKENVAELFRKMGYSDVPDSLSSVTDGSPLSVVLVAEQMKRGQDAK